MQLRFNTSVEQMERNGYKSVLRPTLVGIQAGEPRSEIEARRFFREHREDTLKGMGFYYEK